MHVCLKTQSRPPLETIVCYPSCHRLYKGCAGWYRAVWAIALRFRMVLRRTIKYVIFIGYYRGQPIQQPIKRHILCIVLRRTVLNLSATAPRSLWGPCCLATCLGEDRVSLSGGSWAGDRGPVGMDRPLPRHLLWSSPPRQVPAREWSRHQHRVRKSLGRLVVRKSPYDSLAISHRMTPP